LFIDLGVGERGSQGIGFHKGVEKVGVGSYKELKAIRQ